MSTLSVQPKPISGRPNGFFSKGDSPVRTLIGPITYETHRAIVTQALHEIPGDW